MSALMGLLFFLFGLAVGSFINCLVYRLNTGRQFLWGRSFCDYCQRKLPWYDNLSLLSFLLLRGKCRWCHSPIGWHYPLIELATAFISVFIYVFLILNSQFSILNFVYFLLISYALIGIFLSDLQYRTIPNQIIYPAIIISLIFLISQHPSILISNLLSGLAAAAFFLILVLLTRFKGMGLGDVKLAGLMGVFLGFPKILVALYLAFLTGATLGVILILLGKKKFKSQISFGPFLVLATLIAWFWGEKIWHLIL